MVAVGPVFPTTGKDAAGSRRRASTSCAGPARLTAKPLVAIGGIDAGNLGEVLAAGADAVAVLRRGLPRRRRRNCDACSPRRGGLSGAGCADLPRSAAVHVFLTGFMGAGKTAVGRASSPARRRDAPSSTSTGRSSAARR